MNFASQRAALLLEATNDLYGELAGGDDNEDRVGL